MNSQKRISLYFIYVIFSTTYSLRSFIVFISLAIYMTTVKDTILEAIGAVDMRLD